VLRRLLGSKKMKMVYATGGSRETTRNVPTPKAEQARFCLRDEDVLTLAGYGIRVEEHFSRKAGRDVAMDVEWARDGLDGKIYIVQARPETVASRKPHFVIEEHVLRGTGPLLLTGRAVGTRIGSGAARVLSSLARLSEFRPGEVLVADTTTPDWEPVMKEAAAIVTSRGGRTCHAAIVARELGIPAVVGASGATEKLASGNEVTVSCAHGDEGKVFLGAIPFEVRREDVSRLERPTTHIMVNVGNPDVAFKTSFVPNDGVGLARIEFIIAEHVKAHPLALLHPEKLDEEERRAVLALTGDFTEPSEYFVERLSEGVGTIAAAFYPKPVVVRLSDFKSNEYASLLGGRAFEGKEANPMIGFRGASRYAHPAYAEGFALECAAMRRVRNDMGLENVKLMIPFCRRVEEGKKVLAAMAEHGLERGKDGLEIYVMCEIPNNVILIDEFARIFDGFSIGSNDLTQLTLGVDRDSDLVSFDFDERDRGVLEMLRLAVEGAKRNGRHAGICGQAPSDYPEIAEYLVKLGIDSISLNADTVVATTRRILALEKSLGRAPRSQGYEAAREGRMACRR
jgi:pyruvate,water dikinase